MVRIRKAARGGARTALTAGVIAALAVLASGCSGDTKDRAESFGAAMDGGANMAEEPATGTADAAAGNARAQSGMPQSTGAAKLSTVQFADRKLARSARTTLRTEDVDTAAAEARRIANDAGGYVASERSRKDTATLTLTVPSEEMDAVLDKLADLGERTERQVIVEDLTDQVVDVDSRVASQRESVRRVRGLLEQAKSISDLVAIEQELAQREAELESLLARQDSLRGRVATAPISLTLHEKPVGSDEDDDGFLSGLSSGWSAFTALLGGTAVVLGVTLPFIVLTGVLAGIAHVLWRWRKHARGSAAGAAATGAAGPGSEA